MDAAMHAGWSVWWVWIPENAAMEAIRVGPNFCPMPPRKFDDRVHIIPVQDGHTFAEWRDDGPELPTLACKCKPTMRADRTVLHNEWPT